MGVYAGALSRMEERWHMRWGELCVCHRFNSDIQRKAPFCRTHTVQWAMRSGVGEKEWDCPSYGMGANAPENAADQPHAVW